MSGHNEMSRRQFLAAAGSLAGSLLTVGCSGGKPQEAADTGSPGLGAGASLKGKRFFPDDNPWNQIISKEPVDPNSNALIASIGLDKNLHPDFGSEYRGKPLGIPYVVVAGDQSRVPIRFTADGDESDAGPYPVPPDAPVEADSDRHVLVLDRDNWKLYEMIYAFPEGKGWRANSGAVFDLKTNHFRPAGWTSANAAGLPILPGLVRYDEVMEEKAIRHALAFTCMRSRRAYVHPARHFASKNKDPNLPPMGMRVRLKADFDISPFPACAKVILTALKEYGMFLAQNGGNWYMNGAPDPRWKNKELSALKKVKGRDLEVVKMGTVVTR
jgi:hypothetical protein